MKKTIALFAILLISVFSFAQNPKLNYQAVVRDSQNKLVVEQPVTVTVNVLKADNTSQFEQTLNANTNRNGLMSLEIGDETAAWSNIDWVGAKIRTTVALSDGTQWVDTSNVNAVPYALQTLRTTDITEITNMQNDIATNASNIEGLANRINTFNTNICDSVANCDFSNNISIQNMLQNLTDLFNEQARQIDTLRHMVDSLSNLISNDIFLCGNSKVKDHQGNPYKTVKIGNQCWMAENMRCTTSPSTGSNFLGTSFPKASTSGKMAYYVNGDATNTSVYGLLYNWCAAIDTFNVEKGENSVSNDDNFAPNVVFSGYRRGICPEGWHIPSDAEWSQLTDYVKSQNDYCCNGSANKIGKALASTSGWTISSSDCTIGKDANENNATGFSATPAGGFYEGRFGLIGEGAYFWSATQSDQNTAYDRGLNVNQAIVARDQGGKKAGYSVRCLKDEENGGATVSLPTVATSSVTDITETSATCGGNVTANGGANVTARGVCWSTNQNPTLSNSFTTNDNGTGSFTATLTDLTASTTYYVRAYATNSAGTAYGEEVNFTTAAPAIPVDGQPCPDATTVTDHEGNVYNTVQLGDQCWMAENMRTNKKTNGEEFPYGDCFCPRKSSTSYCDSVNTYGYLYSWYAANGKNSYSPPTSNVRGICPEGWHIPTDDEWETLISYVKSVSEYQCGGTANYIGKSLASKTGWNSEGAYEDCLVAKDQADNNATGFNALPAGSYESGFGDMGSYANFWSANFNAYQLYGGRKTFKKWDSVDSETSLSVRCLKD